MANDENAKVVLTGVSLDDLLLLAKLKETNLDADGIKDALVKAHNFTGEGANNLVLTFEDLTQAQKDSLKGAKGDAFTFEDFTAEQLESLKDAPGSGGTGSDNPYNLAGTDTEIEEGLNKAVELQKDIANIAGLDDKLVNAGVSSDKFTSKMVDLSGISSSASEIDEAVNRIVNCFYVSNNGSDLNNGISANTPFKTLAYLQTKITDNAKVYLERDSVFYEPLRIGTNYCYVDAYGIGKNPIVDGSSVINAATLVSGNVYETTNSYYSEVYVSTDTVGRPVMFENGVAMQPVGTIAECEALPNSYVAITGDEFQNGTYTIRFHTSDNSNPNLNISAYRTNTRACIYDRITGNIVKVNNVDARYAFKATNISLDFGENVRLTNSVSRYGNKHNIYIGVNGYAKDCVAYGSELQGEYGRTSSLFVAYAADSKSSFFTYENCAGFMPLKKADKILGFAIDGFLDHCGGGTRFKQANYLNCYLNGAAGAVVSGSKTVNIQECYFENITYRPLSGTSDKFIVSDTFIQGTSLTYANVSFALDIKNSSLIKLTFASITGNVSISNSLVFGGAKIGSAAAIDFLPRFSYPATLKVNNSIIFNYKYLLVSTTGNYTGNYNVFYSPTAQIIARFDDVYITTLSAWQTASGQDSQSVYLSDAQAKVFFLTDPNTGIVTVNPYAEVTSASGTVYVGTFPDGTSLLSKFNNKNYSHIKSKYKDVSSQYEYKN